MDFPIHIATIRMGLSIICFQRFQVDFKYVLHSRIIAFITGNNADPGEMQHCQITILWVSSKQRASSPLSDLFDQVMSLRKEWRMPKLKTGLNNFNHWSMHHQQSVKKQFLS